MGVGAGVGARWPAHNTGGRHIISRTTALTGTRKRRRAAHASDGGSALGVGRLRTLGARQMEGCGWARGCGERPSRRDALVAWRELAER